MKLKYSGAPARFPDQHLELKGGEIVEVGEEDAKLLLMRPDFMEVGANEEHEEIQPQEGKGKRRG